MDNVSAIPVSNDSLAPCRPTLILLPVPRSLSYGHGSCLIARDLAVRLDGEVRLLYQIAQPLLKALVRYAGVSADIRAADIAKEDICSVRLTLAPQLAMRPQGYELSITSDQIHVIAADSPGLYYGIQTLIQLLRQCHALLPVCTIVDYPDFPTRGVMLDISRDKVPTMDTLLTLIDELSEWKVNYIELYTEHAFAYPGHEEVWAQASPLTGQDILRLDAYCRDRFIELAPNQNSFGHLGRWLKLPRYNHLAECPGGFDHGGKHFDEPETLAAANPACVGFLDDLYSALLPHFTSRNFNVGCDETVELGLGQSTELCQQRGKGRVYLDFLLKIHELVQRRGCRMHFWGDIIIKHPELVKDLPRDVTVLEWGYEANHPFDEHCACYAQSGIPFFVCPGTSSWCSIAGRSDNCLGNLRSAAQYGLKHGATGYMNTDWGDLGHWQYLPISYLGLAAGAALSWCYQTNNQIDFIDQLDIHVFHDHAGIMGKLVRDLGNTYLHVEPRRGNRCSLAWGLFEPREPLSDATTEQQFVAAEHHVEATLAALSSARMHRRDAALIQAELRNAADMLLAACHRGVAIRRGNFHDRLFQNRFARDWRKIMGAHAELWVARNRVGGLFDSLKRMNELLNFTAFPDAHLSEPSRL